MHNSLYLNIKTYMIKIYKIINKYLTLKVIILKYFFILTFFDNLGVVFKI